MLVHLSVRNFAIVEQLDLELHGGMSVITGETGAGKSIMLDALGLALGDRTDSSIVRHGAERADVLATFDVSDIPEAQHWLRERDLTHEGAQCLLRRVITAEGRSRGYINGTPCPLSDLKALGELLIDIHSQHEHQSLLKPDTHRRLLDAYAGADSLAAETRQAAALWRKIRQQINVLSQSGAEQQARRQLLTYQLEELDAAAPDPDELAALEHEQRTLGHAETLLAVCQQVLNQCSDGDGTPLLTQLHGCMQRLSTATGRPAALDAVLELLNSAHIQLTEASDELRHFTSDFEADPHRLAVIEARLDTLYQLARKHRVQPSALAALRDQLHLELQRLESSGTDIEALQQALTDAATEWQRLAAQLRQQRASAALQLAQAVEHEMQALGMPGGRFSIVLLPMTGEDPQPQGLETVEFHVSANPGQPLRPIVRVASGGELSRISLAIQVITAQTSRTPTLVFDEVDVGIGGPTAEVVGRLLRQLGERGQVLTVTHLPQVAAQGHQHLFVHKRRDTDATSTAVACLTPEQRVEELARMLSGVDLTQESLAHARRMMRGAQ